MTQAINQPQRPPEYDDEQPLPGLHRNPLTESQRLEAVRRLQDQAEHRIRIGLDLFKAAEAHTSQHRRLLKELQDERFELYEKMQREMTQSFDQYEQWIGQIEQNIANSVDRLEARIDALQAAWENSQQQVQQLMQRSDAMVAKANGLLTELEKRVLAATQTAKAKRDATATNTPPAPPARPVESLTAATLPASTPPAMTSLERPAFNADHKPATPMVAPAQAIDLQSMLAASRRRRAEAKASTIEVAADHAPLTATIRTPDEQDAAEAKHVIEVPTRHAPTIIKDLSPPEAKSETLREAKTEAIAEASPEPTLEIVPEVAGAQSDTQSLADAPAEVVSNAAADASPDEAFVAAPDVAALNAIADDPCMLPPVFEEAGDSPDQAAMLREVADQVNRAAHVLSETSRDVETASKAAGAVAADALDDEDDYVENERYTPAPKSPATTPELKHFFIDIIERMRKEQRDDA